MSRSALWRISLWFSLFLVIGLLWPSLEAQAARKYAPPEPNAVTVVPPAGPRSAVGACRAVDEVPHRLCYSPTSGGGGLCQPQCIPYVRCRSGLSSCRLGNTSPVQLYLCEQKRNNTSVIPEPGSLMAIGIDRSHNITTGHTLYVEEVCSNPDGTYKLRVSHTNYDRRCHLEENAWAVYDSRSMQADFITGNWAAWGNNLPVQGFILTDKEPEGDALSPLLGTHDVLTDAPPLLKAKPDAKPAAAKKDQKARKDKDAKVSKDAPAKSTPKAKTHSAPASKPNKAEPKPSKTKAEAKPAKPAPKSVAKPAAKSAASHAPSKPAAAPKAKAKAESAKSH